MGVVLRATHLDLDCTVAIKVIRPEHAQNEDFVDRLMAEARIAASLRSKYANRVLDVGRSSRGEPYLVLEYMEGEDLGRHLDENGPLDVTRAVDYILQACEALAEAHALGIVHRDLKPDNLFLCQETDGSSVLKVLDFGISKAPRSRQGGRAVTRPRDLVGTPEYMAPEQIRGASVVDARADIWTLGVILQELCTGQMPFEAESIQETLKLILAGEPASPAGQVPGLPPELLRVIDKCLKQEPDERYQNVVELAADLVSLASDGKQAGRVAKVAATTCARVNTLPGSVRSQRASAPRGTPFAVTMRQSLMQVLEAPPRRAPRLWLVAAAAGLPLALGFGYLLTSRSAETTDGRVTEAEAKAFIAPALAPDPAAQNASPLPTEEGPVVAAAPAEVDAPALDSSTYAALPSPAPAQAWTAPAKNMAMEEAAEAALTVPAPNIESAVPEASTTEAALELASQSEAVANDAEEPTTAATPAPGDSASAPTPAPAQPPANSARPAAPAHDAWDRRSFGGRR